MSPEISVVIPVHRDTTALTRLLQDLRSQGPALDIVVVEGSDDVSSREAATRAGARWMATPRGRGLQLQRGAATCRGRTLWFLHADAQLIEGAVNALQQAMFDAATVGGAFRFRLSGSRWYRWMLESAVNWRTRALDLPYGDQGIFVRRTIYEEMGGFSPLPVMEDVELLGRLRRRGRLAYLDHPLDVCPRRWDEEGFLKASGRNMLLLVAFKLGVPAHLLQGFYPPPRD